MSATTFPAFIDALVTALGLRAGLAGVRIFGCPVDPEDLGAEGIELAEDVTIQHSREAYSGLVEETYAVHGSILVAAPMVKKATAAATINAAAKVARDRCDAILGEVADELADNDTMSGTVRDVFLDSVDYHQGMAPEGQLGRVTWAEFSLAVTADIST